MLLLDDAGGGGKDAESSLPLAGIRRLAGLEEGAQEIGPCFPRTIGVDDLLIGVLSCNLGNGVCHLVPHRGNRLAYEALEELCADGIPLWRLEGEEQLARLAGRVLGSAGGYATEEHGGKGTSLRVEGSAMMGGENKQTNK